MTMIIYPAIDIQGGEVVRLKQGKFDEVTHYASDPTEMAHQWVAKGAPWLHVVDLDGAKTGTAHNIEKILDIARSITIPVQMGGGVRDKATLERLIEGGVSRVVLGTKAIEDRDFLKEALSRWPDKIAVSLDCNDGKITQRGWTETSDILAIDFAQELEQMGLKTLIYTDIKTDGMLTGPNYDALEALLAVTSIPVIASGGIARLDDIRQLNTLVPKGLNGAITGRAIYEGTLDLEEALALC